MSRILRGRRGRLGALVSKDTADKLESDFLTPLLESFSMLTNDVNNASVFAEKNQINALLDGAYSGIQALADRLSKLDGADVATWKADVVSAQQQVNQLTNEFAVYSDGVNRAALYSGLAAMIFGGLTSAVVYRRKNLKRWTVLSGAASAAAVGLTTWSLTRPKFE